MKLDNLAQALDVLRHADVLIDEQLCINSRARGMVCRACEKACGVGAISPDVDQVDLDEQACTGCGACVPACPAGALASTVFEPQRLLDALAGSSVAHIHCTESKDGGGGIVIPCHMLLDGRLGAAAQAVGVREMVLHSRPACADCHRGNALPVIQRAADDLLRWFGDGAMVLRNALPGESAGSGVAQREDQIKASRRSFLRLAGVKAAASAAWLVPLADPQPMQLSMGISVSETFKQQPVPYQQVLAQHAEALPWTEETLLPWVERSFTDDCSACGVCANRCPSGALKRLGGEGLAGVTFTASVCTNCGLCSAVCPESAVRAAACRSITPVAAPERILVSRPVAACSCCGQDFAVSDGQNLCPQCSNERAMDEDWLGMLG